jgi:hypothetical protein
MDEVERNEQLDNVDIPEYDFTSEEGTGTTAAETQPQPQPQVQEPAPQAGTQNTGYYVRTAAQEYTALKKQYEDLNNRIKQMRELGYPTEELERDSFRLEARLAAAEMAMREAQRLDARYRVPLVVDKLLQDIPADTANRVRPKFRETLEQAVYQDPSILDNTAALTLIMQAAIGAVNMEDMKRKRPGQLTPTGSVSSPNPPPAPNQRPTEVPEVAKRLGLKEEVWRKVEQLPEGSGWVDLDF